jgi:magnesium-transporting ATPase (P-type)
VCNLFLYIYLFIFIFCVQMCTCTCRWHLANSEHCVQTENCGCWLLLLGHIECLFPQFMRGISVSQIALESLDLITIVVPPALPAAMTVGRFYAQNRLQAKNVYCISPRTINVSGSIDCVCFDKVCQFFEIILILNQSCILISFNCVWVFGGYLLTYSLLEIVPKHEW